MFDIATQNPKEKPREKTTFYLTDELIKMLNTIQELGEHKSRNASVEEAVKFYFAFLTESISQEFLCGVFGNKIDSTLSRSNDRIASLLYKNSVELNLLARLIASDRNVSPDTYSNMRRKAVEDVKKSNGRISLKEISSEE